MIVRHLLSSVNEANVFVVVCEETRDALVVDAGAFDPELPATLHELGATLKAAFITHDHYDHTDGLKTIVDTFGLIEVYAGKTPIGRCAAMRVAHGDTIRIGKLEGKVLATPGHTPEGLSLAFPGNVFTGDALFAGSVGGTSSGEQARQQLEAIRANIFTLPALTEIHVGHGPSTTVSIESRFNPFFV